MPLLLLLFSVAGCSLPSKAKWQPLVDENPLHPPEQWQSLQATASPGNRSTQPVTHWGAPLHTPQLDLLITEAMRHNHSLQRATLNWQHAQQQSVLATTPLRPTLEGSISANRNRTLTSSESTLLTTRHGVELRAQWELDLWQRLSDQQRAAQVREEASATDLQAARLSLAASVTRGWFSAVESKMQIQLSNQRLDRYNQALEVIEARYRSGLTDALDLHMARSEVALAEEQLLSQQMNQQRQLRMLEILLGRYPSAEIRVAETLPIIDTPIPAGLPSELLERRPDIIANRARWQAATLDGDVAAKRRLPSFSLTAQAGTSSSTLRDLLDWDHLVWNLLGNLTQPLLQHEKLEAEEQIKRIAQQQAASEYLESVLNAFHEVEQGLTTDQFQQQRGRALADAAENAREAATLALSRYQNGLIDVLTLLDTQQRAFDRESSQIQALADRIDNRILLHLALGGPFQ